MKTIILVVLLISLMPFINGCATTGNTLSTDSVLTEDIPAELEIVRNGNSTFTTSITLPDPIEIVLDTLGTITDIIPFVKKDEEPSDLPEVE